MKINFIISGHFLGCKIRKYKNILYFKNKNTEKIYLTKSFIKEFDLIYCTNLKNVKYKSKQKYSVLIHLKEGQKSLLELNENFYNTLLKELS